MLWLAPAHAELSWPPRQLACSSRQRTVLPRCPSAPRRPENTAAVVPPQAGLLSHCFHGYSTSSLIHKSLLRKVQPQSPWARGCSLQWPRALVMTTYLPTQTYSINLQATDRSRAVSQPVIFCRVDAIRHILKVLLQQNTWFNAKPKGVPVKPVAPLMVFKTATWRAV